MAIASLLFLIALLGLLLGMIKPSLVLWWGVNKTRFRVFLIFGSMFIISMCLATIFAPSNIEAGKTAITEKNYKEAVTRLEAIKPTEAGYTEAQQLLPEAKKNYLLSTLEAAGEASIAGDHNKVIALLTNFPTSEPLSNEASKILTASKVSIAEAKIVQVEEEKKREMAAVEESAKEKQRKIDATDPCDLYFHKVQTLIDSSNELSLSKPSDPNSFALASLATYQQDELDQVKLDLEDQTPAYRASACHMLLKQIKD